MMFLFGDEKESSFNMCFTAKNEKKKNRKRNAKQNPEKNIGWPLPKQDITCWDPLTKDFVFT